MIYNNDHLMIIFLLLILNTTNAQIGIGTQAPDASALLKLKSNNKGFLLPRMTSVEQAAMVNIAKCLATFNTTTN